MGYADLCRNGKYKCVLYGELYTRYNERIFNVNSRTNTEATEVKRNDILFPTSTTVDAISLISPSCVNEDNIRVGGDLFGIRPYQNIDGNFISYCINNFNPVKYSFAKQAQGLTIVHLQYNAIKNEKIKIPSLKEQNKMSDLFIQIDNLITLHQRKSYIKIYSWEQRKFSELVLIERGGSPRPIEDYITNEPDGLNWIKIGDAPSQGHYITKTAEKIKPEGLSKTRQVQPGDLILSNSMSFGKPYIMGINGCIHDGWLLIRDTNKRFDLTFLCHLLGTTQMLEQYKSFAAGSTVNNLNKELVGNTVVTVPKIDEQKVLGQYFENLDHLITLHQH